MTQSSMKFPDPLKIVAVADIPKATDVPLDNLMTIFRLCNKMEKICDENNGIGLSANQVGIPWKLFILKRNRTFEYYVNCDYIGEGEKMRSVEGCLSLRNESGEFRRFEVERFSKIKLNGKQLIISGMPSLVLHDVSREEKDLFAVVFQHEIDHGSDKLISDIGKEVEISD
jgi:peptide deformylase